jgi:choline dehydrogenase-like flavoprotein
MIHKINIRRENSPLHPKRNSSSGHRDPKGIDRIKKFDYIVIGAGTAGGVVAKKLTDDRHTSVLVLEPGINSTAQLSSPNILDAISLASDNKFAFNYISRLEPSLQRQLITLNGRVIGGSQEVNYMYAVRGSKELYDEWAAITGEPQWSYNQVRPLFIENETYTGLTQSPNERGRRGPIFIRQQHIPPNGLIKTLANATETVLDIPIVEDYNTGIRDCTFLKGQFIQKEEANGTITRSSTATGYLNESIVSQGNEFHPDEFGVGRRKLVIFGKTTVNKVLFKKKKGRMIAAGVEYVKDGVTHKTFARKGVIVSAGFHSSVILQRSGIGKASDLLNAGITPLIENPNVGYNLQTQTSVGMGVRVDTSQLIPILVSDPNQPLIYGAFIAEDKNSLEGRRLQISGAPAPFFLPNPDVLSNEWEFDLTKPTNIMSFGLIDLNPRSKGTIMASHSDPEALPSFSFNPLQPNTNDIEFLVDQYINMYNIIVEARSHNSGIHEVVFPTEDIFTKPEAEKRRLLRDFVRASYSNFFHYGGQCRMAKSIQDGVVNGFLDVFGTVNLKVADLSIAPILPDGNTSIPAQMIGLNAARFIQTNPHPYVLDDEDFDDFVESDSGE